MLTRGLRRVQKALLAVENAPGGLPVSLGLCGTLGGLVRLWVVKI
jgi:hypothetical protein